MNHGRSHVSRRQLLGLGVGLGVALVACGPSGPPTRPGQTSGTPAAATPAPNGGLGSFLPRPATPTPSPTPGPVRIRLGYWQTDASATVLADQARGFEQANPRIVVETVQQSFAGHLSSFAAAAARGSALDVALDAGPYLDSQRQARLLLELGPLATSDHLDLGGYWSDPSTRPVGGALAALPLWVDLDLLYYNRDRLTEAKVAAPAESWTWNDLLAAAEHLSEGKPGAMTRWGLLVVDDIQGGWGSFVASNGGTFLDPATGKTTLGSAEAAEALRFVRDAIVAHHAAPGPSEQQSLTNAGQTNPFLDGAVAMLLSGTWLMSTTLQSARFGWDVAAVPRSPRTNQGAPTYVTQPVVIPRATSRPAEAWELLRFLVGPESQAALARGKVRLPSLKSASTESRAGYVTEPPLHLGAATASLSRARDLQFLPGWMSWRAAVVNALEPAFDGRVDFDSALKQAVAEGDAALARAGTERG